MTTYAALLRGINVGGHKKVPMAELRDLMAGLGWSDVRTYLQSGNAVFTTGDADPGDRLERAVADRFGFEVRCLVRTAAELRAVADACPYPAAELDPAKLVVLFLEEAPGESHFGSLDGARFAPDTFEHVGSAVYCYFPDGMGRSKLPSALESVSPKVVMTGRNWRTVQRLIELAS
ncbi:DUF1697 domain-containing protein [Streptomyces sp. WMMB 322]|uniref:DUF1697 domain-containing protein n=1 Tax=Streptomyces sp. WMMB 322 TaxID=1286821 RepID=UPI0006E13F97|nr:DUF1697 domain-containing protein [Streptomyces sp. WMMB 322]SCK42997.1 Uncharacterized conserved protein, DUF1697 family [Streptomyces sp. WMMB 322]